MRYLNAIVKFLTFPGGFLRGFWEQLFCRIYGVPVENKKYFQFNEMAGHVEHEPVGDPVKNFFFCFFAGLMVFLAGVLFAIPAVLNLMFLDVINETWRLFSLGFLYLALSMFTNLFPSIEDALTMWEKYKSMSGVMKIIFAPGAAIMYAGAYAENVGATLITNIALAAVVLLV